MDDDLGLSEEKDGGTHIWKGAAANWSSCAPSNGAPVAHNIDDQMGKTSEKMNVEPWIEIAAGTSGDAVRGMQHLLRAHGSTIAADGSFGPVTDGAVRSFQTANGLPVDGVVGPITWPRLVIETAAGSSGEAVRGVQSFGLLIMPGDLPLTDDGIYGSETESRVRAFQSLWGLVSDGIAGRGTWSYLSADKRTVWPLVRPGASEPSNFRVRTLQYLLRARGFDIGVDGLYGPQTAEAVRQFALRAHRRVD